jgi:hypothetical protein
MNPAELFAGKVEKAPFRTIFATVTPKMAAEILARFNQGNRKVSPFGVSRLRGAMADGMFRTTHQGIAFDRNGALRDGAHRLVAIVESGKAQTLMVSFGLEPEAMQVIDIGRRRTFRDILLIGTSLVVNNRLPGIISVIDRGREALMGQVRADEVVDIYLRHQTVAEKALELLGKPSSRVGSAPVAGVIGRALYTHDAASLRPFCEALVEPSGRPSHTWAAQQLHLVLKDYRSLNDRESRNHLYGQTQTALIYYLSGQGQNKRTKPLPPTEGDVFAVSEAAA